MGNNNSINRANFERVKTIINNKDFIIINTLPVSKQDILIKGTLEINDEERLLNELIKKDKSRSILIYGENSCDETLVKKYNQLNKLVTYGHEEFCGKHGICNKKSGLCECFPGWAGVFCRKPLCHEECELNGVCSKAGKCICTKDYFGRSCEKKFQHGKTRTVEMRNKDLAKKKIRLLGQKLRISKILQNGSKSHET